MCVVLSRREVLGDVEETGGASFGNVEGDVDGKKDSDGSKEHSGQSKNTCKNNSNRAQIVWLTMLTFTNRLEAQQEKMERQIENGSADFVKELLATFYVSNALRFSVLHK